MGSKDVPSQVRIRTDDGNEYRYDEIMKASNLYDVNKTRAVVFACHDVPGLIDAAGQVLDRDDLTHEQKREIAETMNGNVRGVEFDVEETVTVSTND